MSDEKPKVQLAGGGEVTPDHRELKPNGQQKGYVVLTPEERAKGFVRPVRDAYLHVGAPGPRYPLRDVTDAEKKAVECDAYVKYETYPESESPKVGKFWTQEQLDKVGKGCGTLTRMSRDIAETYARDPHFYSGTFCVGCGIHLPVGEFGEFVWDGTDERVGT